ncbi:MAG: class I SAM-dependent methyltransferase [Deltaproteobacteria bacterium]|nr:class I SAM-dependent methyltransferase [Deltaproteobacteria bacterium]
MKPQARRCWISRSAVETASENLAGEGLRAVLKPIENHHYPFPDHFFDIVVAWNSLPYTDEESLQSALSEVKRTLKPGGMFFATFATFKDSRVTEGRKISERTFEVTLSNQKGSVIHAAKDEEQVRKLFGLFERLEIGYSEITVKGVTISHWILYGR